MHGSRAEQASSARLRALGTSACASAVTMCASCSTTAIPPRANRLEAIAKRNAEDYALPETIQERGADENHCRNACEGRFEYGLGCMEQPAGHKAMECS